MISVRDDGSHPALGAGVHGRDSDVLMRSANARLTQAKLLAVNVRLAPQSHPVRNNFQIVDKTGRRSSPTVQSLAENLARSDDWQSSWRYPCRLRHSNKSKRQLSPLTEIRGRRAHTALNERPG